MPVEASTPAIFPSWVEVPHLTGPLSTGDYPDVSPSADGLRTFLDPHPADTAEQPGFLPPRVNPRLPLIGRAPLDAARLTHEQSPVWNEHTERRDGGTSVPPPVVATLEPDVPQQSQNRAGTGPTPAPILPPRSAQMQTPTEVLGRPAPTISAVHPPGRVATLNPDPARQVVDRTSPI
ncbi:hypothetical protein, partial [Methylobacterium sp. E-066]|uniref:hypothetical protein n=1 Tax=Methylobacterium sp. E-066 TaxID=2836584 RepID=UPI001FBB123F